MKPNNTPRGPIKSYKPSIESDNSAGAIMVDS